MMEKNMTELKKKSHILGAAILLANATFLLATSAQAAVHVDAPNSARVIMESVTGFFSIEESVTAHLTDQHVFQTAKDASNTASFRITGNTKMQMQQTVVNPNTTGSFQNGAPQKPQQATAGEEIRKILKKLDKEHCGKPNSIC
jgi:hypothetical protein